MFNKLKEKLKGWLSKSKEKIEEKEEKVGEPKKEVKPEKVEKTKKKSAKKPEKTRVIENLPDLKPEEQGTAIEIETEIEEGVPQDIIDEELREEIKKPGFLEKIKSKFAYKITEKEFDEIFEDLEMLLLENNTALESVEDIRSRLSKKLIGKEMRQQEIEEYIKQELKETLKEILIEPDNPINAIKLKKSEHKPFVILFFGINGTGKCVHEESHIQLSNGKITKIKDLYNQHKKINQEKNIEDGKMIDISSQNLYVPSFNPNNLKIENKKATHLWKLKKEDLIKIKLDNGNDYSIKVTPEHPFFILRNGKVIKIRADEVNEFDYISIPNKIKINGKIQSIIEDIEKLDLFVYVSQEEAKQNIFKKYKSLKQTHKNLKFKKNYCQFTVDIKKGKIPIEFRKDEDLNFIKIKHKNSTKPITIPTYLTSEFAEFLGYVIGDGHIEKDYVEISNENPELISRIKDLSKALFNLKPQIKRDTRTKKMFDIRLCSTTLVKILKIFNLKPGKKGKNIEIPLKIMISENGTIKSFLRAYFDCDSHPYSKTRNIELISESKILIQQTSYLLKRFGILSTISKKIINNIPYWRLSIKSKYAEFFSDKISYLIREKQNKVEMYHEIGLYQGCGKQDMIPLGKSLNHLRLQLGFSRAEIQKYVPGYQIYEKKGIISKDRLKLLVKYYKEKKLGNFYHFLYDLSKRNIKKYPNTFLNGIITQLKSENLILVQNKKISITNNGNTYIQIMKSSQKESQDLLKTFECLTNSNVCWIQIKEINKIKNDKKNVYDLTIEDNHSFIADGFIVHNTTSIAKLTHLLQKNNFSCVLAAGDTFRAASIEQIQIHADKLKVPLIKQDYGADPSAVGFDAIKYAEKHKIDVVLIDTAGRMHTKTNLLAEMEKICRITNPDLKIFVAESIAGNDATEQAKTFNEMIEIDGSILSKADVDEKGGTIISISHATNKPIFYLGTGQNYEDLEFFDKEKFIENLGL